MCRIVSIAGLIYCGLTLWLSQDGNRSFAQLPDWANSPSAVVGKVRFRVFIFDVYDAQLLAPGGQYNGIPPYALKLSYLREVKKQTIIDISVDEMSRLGTKDALKLEKWEAWMSLHFPNMAKGDEAMMVALGNGGMEFYHNGKKNGQNDDSAFTSAFFGIWLSEDALEPDLSRQLRGLESD